VINLQQTKAKLIKMKLKKNKVIITVYGADININIKTKKRRKIMKKLTLAIIMLFSFFSIASAELGVKIGATLQVGEMETSGSEKNTTTGNITNSDKEKALFGTAGYFIEKDLSFLPGPLSRLSIGYDNIVHDLDLGTQTNVRTSAVLKAGGVIIDAGTSHSLEAAVTGFSTLYGTLNITDWLYVKGGQVTVDLKTKFVGTATSTYGTNHSLDGTVYGVGIHKQSDDGLFFRAEWNDYNIDGKTVTNTGTDSVFTATLNDTSGSTGRISIGKAF
jgi:hypothetical protein